MTNEGKESPQAVSPENAEGYYRLGNEVYEKEKFEEAANYFRKAVELNPKHERAWHHLALALACIEKYSEALDAINHAIDLSPSLPEARYIKGLVLEYLGRYTESKIAYDEAILLNPNYENAKRRREMLLIRYFKKEKDNEKTQKLDKLEKNKFEAKENTNRDSKISSQSDPVIEYYNMLCEQKQNDAHILNSFGSYLAMKGKLESAERILSKAVAVDKEYAEAWHNLGFVLYRMERYSESIRCLTEALIRNPNIERAHFYKGKSLFMLGRIEESIISFENAIKIMPTAECYVEMGIAYMKIGKNADALQYFDRAIELSPDCEEAWYNKGVAYGNLG
ncbi:MAG: tetratricopeptide repeat protein, partial [Thermoplasmata archaeon]